MRFHLFPFRTEKLSSLTPMVLRLSRGRVGSRLFKGQLQSWPFFVFLPNSGMYAISCSYPTLKEPAKPPNILTLSDICRFSLLTLGRSRLRLLLSLNRNIPFPTLPLTKGGSLNRENRSVQLGLKSRLLPVIFTNPPKSSLKSRMALFVALARQSSPATSALA